LLKKKCQWETFTTKDGKTGGKCIYAKKTEDFTPVPPPEKSMAKTNEIQFDSKDEQEFDKMKREDFEDAEEEDDLRHRRHHRCHVCHFFLAVGMFILGLITSCLRSKFCPNCCRCCCRTPTHVASSQVIIPAVVVSGTAAPICIKQEPPVITSN